MRAVLPQGASCHRAGQSLGIQIDDSCSEQAYMLAVSSIGICVVAFVDARPRS